MIRTLKNIWKRFVAFHNSRLVVNLTKHSKEQYEANVSSHFESAKRLSDFIAMALRWSFTQFAAFYFFEKGRSAEFWLSKLAYDLCWGAALIISVVMGIRIGTIILLWWSSDLHGLESRAGKIFGLTLAITFTAILFYGTNNLVRDLAQASSLLGSSAR